MNGSDSPFEEPRPDLVWKHVWVFPGRWEDGILGATSPMKPNPTPTSRPRDLGRLGLLGLRLLLPCLWFAACSPPPGQAPDAARPTASASGTRHEPMASDERAAGVTRTTSRLQVAAPSEGPLMLGEVDNGFRKIPIPLGADLGFLVMNAGDEEEPSPRIALGRKDRHEVLTFKTVADFEAALRHLPAGALLHRHDRCLRPAASGLDTGFLEGVEQALARSGVRVAPDTVVTCLCGR